MQKIQIFQISIHAVLLLIVLCQTKIKSSVMLDEKIFIMFAVWICGTSNRMDNICMHTFSWNSMENFFCEGTVVGEENNGQQ